MTIFTDSYRTELSDYDYCGDDYMVEMSEYEEESDFRAAEEWFCASEGKLTNGLPSEV